MGLATGRTRWYNTRMKIAILGAGFTGLTAALKLAKQGHSVTLIEKESSVGGLASGFKIPGWDWYLDRFYHHLFANDDFAFSLAKDVGQKIVKAKPKTNTYIKEQIFQLDSPLSLLTFPFLSPIDKFRTGATLAYFKLLNNYQSLEGKLALNWIRKFMGKTSTNLIWGPLFTGKFGNYKEEISLTWFWARIKKRSSELFYPEGGFQTFANKIAEKIKKLDGEILLDCEIKQIISSSTITLRGCNREFDIVISTLPTPVFTKITPNLPKSYAKRINSIPHLSTQVLVLILNKPFLQSSYWLNINDPSFPFLVLAEHTNFMDCKNYGGKHILYIGNYLPKNHPYLKLSAKELFQIYKPYLQKISPSSSLFPLSPHLFTSSNAQPVVTTKYSQQIPTFQTPLKNIFLANLDMVYPWDRGVNYAIELGEKIAKIVCDKKSEK